MADPPRVLYVDDDPQMTQLVSECLARYAGFDVTTAGGVDAAHDRIEAAEIDCVVSDYDMGATDGLEFLATVRERHPNLPFVLFTGKGSEEIASEAISAGVTDYVQKGAGAETYQVLGSRVENAVERYRTERALRESEARYRTVVERSHDAIYVDRDGQFRFVNERLCEISGYEEETLLAMEIWDLIHPDDEARVREIERERLYETDGSSTHLARMVTADGEPIHGEFSVKRLDAGDEVLGSIRDITARVQREAALERYETIVQAAGDPVYTLDASGCFTFVNDRLAEITGHGPEELLGRHVSAVMERADVAAGEALIRDLLRHEDRDRRTFEMDVVTASGDRIRCENHVALLPFADGEFRGTTGVLREITDREERQRTLERQNERLAELARVVGHDLRNPLNVAGLALEVARESPTADNFDRARRAIERMEELIADVLLLARGETIELEPEPAPLSAVVERAWETTETAGASLRSPDDLGTVTCDERRTCRLLANLFRNAVEHGGVTVRVRAIDDGIVVEDDGPGLPDVDDETLFSMGYSGPAGGTGCGLAIVRDVARAHGWTVASGESDLGGAAFELVGLE